MRKMVIAFAFSAFLFSCSSGPESAAKNFTENLAKGKVDEAKKYATESTGMMLDFASGFGGLPIEPNFSFEMVKDSVEGDKGWVTFINQDGETETIKLVKIDGDWLVHMEPEK